MTEHYTDVDEIKDFLIDRILSKMGICLQN